MVLAPHQIRQCGYSIIDPGAPVKSCDSSLISDIFLNFQGKMGFDYFRIHIWITT